jgi:hypothetical protein
MKEDRAQGTLTHAEEEHAEAVSDLVINVSVLYDAGGETCNRDGTANLVTITFVSVDVQLDVPGRRP